MKNGIGVVPDMSGIPAQKNKDDGAEGSDIEEGQDPDMHQLTRFEGARWNKDQWLEKLLSEDMPDNQKKEVAILRIFPNGEDIKDEVLVPIRTGINIVGRSASDTDVNIVARGVSGVHAAIEISPSGTEHFIQDLGSTNGTSLGVSSFRITPLRSYELSHNKEVKFEPVRCRYEILEEVRKLIDAERNGDGVVSEWLDLPSSSTVANLSQPILSGLPTAGQRVLTGAENKTQASEESSYHIPAPSQTPSQSQPHAVVEQKSDSDSAHAINPSPHAQPTGLQSISFASAHPSSLPPKPSAVTPTQSVKQPGFAVPSRPGALIPGVNGNPNITPTQLVSLTVPATQTLSAGPSPSNNATPTQTVTVPATLVVPPTVPLDGIAETLPVAIGTLIVDQDDRGSGSDGEDKDPSPSLRAASGRKPGVLLTGNQDVEAGKHWTERPGMLTMLVDDDGLEEATEEVADHVHLWDGETQQEAPIDFGNGAAGFGDATLAEGDQPEEGSGEEVFDDIDGKRNQRQGSKKVHFQGVNGNEGSHGAEDGKAEASTELTNLTDKPTIPAAVNAEPVDPYEDEENFIGSAASADLGVADSQGSPRVDFNAVNDEEYKGWMAATVPEDDDQDDGNATDLAENTVEAVERDDGPSPQNLEGTQSEASIGRPGRRVGRIVISEDEDESENAAVVEPASASSKDASSLFEPVGIESKNVVADEGDDGDETEAEDDDGAVASADAQKAESETRVEAHGGAETAAVSVEPAEKGEEEKEDSSLGFGFTAPPVGRRRGVTYSKRGKAAALPVQDAAIEEKSAYIGVEEQVQEKGEIVSESPTGSIGDAGKISEVPGADDSKIGEMNGEEDSTSTPARGSKRGSRSNAASATTTPSIRGRRGGKAARGGASAGPKSQRGKRGKNDVEEQDVVDEASKPEERAQDVEPKENEEDEDIVGPTPQKSGKGILNRGNAAEDTNVEAIVEAADEAQTADRKSKGAQKRNGKGTKRKGVDETDRAPSAVSPTGKRRKSLDVDKEESKATDDEKEELKDAQEAVTPASRGRKRKTAAAPATGGRKGKGKKAKTDDAEGEDQDAPLKTPDQAESKASLKADAGGPGDVDGAKTELKEGEDVATKEHEPAPTKGGRGGKRGSASGRGAAKGKRKAVEEEVEMEESAASKRRRTPASSRETTPTPAAERPASTATPLTRRASSFLAHGSQDKKPKVMFTGIAEDDERREIVEFLGGELVDTWHECTHLVTDKIRRTVKFLCSVAAGKFVLDVKWLDACRKANDFVDEGKFTLKDTKSEKQYGISLAKTLAYTRDTSNAGVFSSYVFAATQHLRPPLGELSEIVSSGGGRCVGVEEVEKMGADVGDGVGSMVGDDGTKKTVVVVGSGAKEDEGVVGEVKKAGWRVMSVEVVLMGVLRGEVDLTT
ncbi:Mediator of DNA damage checkpoint protein 1 [Rhizophlyctis rosea]|nr:Mediator of DNA damage checkpoint protein 1 [Rhizophlyctis rosea]